MEGIELDEEMDMPCRCDCGTWFDLEMGRTVPGSNIVYCPDCAEEKRKEYYEEIN